MYDAPIAVYDQSEYKFTGKERDGESGLDYFIARHYASSLARFMQPDEPLMGQDEADPQSLNLYSYVRNNPLNRVDPDGRDCVYTSNQTVVLGDGDSRAGSLLWGQRYLHQRND